MHHNEPLYHVPKFKVGKYEIRRQIGRGNQATVYEGMDTETMQTSVAIKQFWRDDTRIRPALETYKNELNILSKASHRNIARLLLHEEQDSYLYIVMELCDGGDLTSYFEHSADISINSRMIMCCDACEGLLYLHHNNILHRDIKPQNLLIKNTHFHPTLVIGDYGISRFLPRGTLNPVTLTGDRGTPGWMAPEVHSLENSQQTAKYNVHCDTFSLGQVLCAILTQKPGEALEPLPGTKQYVMNINSENDNIVYNEIILGKLSYFVCCRISIRKIQICW